MNSLEWEHVWARYERRWVLRDVSARVESGQVLYLVGPAGGGKSAMLRAGEGAMRAESGRLWVNGHAARRFAGSVLGSDEPLLDALTVERNIARRLRRAGIPPRGMDRRLLSAVRTWELDDWRETRVRALSDSLRQRVALAAQWACPGSVWLLDNPTTLLEPAWRAAWPTLLSAWREREGGAAVIATNLVEEAMAGDRAAIVHEGRIVALDTPARLCRASGPEEIVVRTADDRAAAASLAGDMRLQAERRPDGLLLRVRRADDALPGVLRTLGGSLETVWVRSPTMENAIAFHTALPAPSDLPTQPPAKG
jgi:ABC-type multidrug transport system ATPase subunit